MSANKGFGLRSWKSFLRGERRAGGWHSLNHIAQQAVEKARDKVPGLPQVYLQMGRVYL
jgi:hypothetical protein